MRAVWAYFDQAEANCGVSWPITYRCATTSGSHICATWGSCASPRLVYAHKPADGGMAERLVAGTSLPRCPIVCPPRRSTRSPARRVRRICASARGARVFKVHLQVGDFDPRDPLLDHVWGHLADAGGARRRPLRVRAAAGRFTGVEPISRCGTPVPRTCGSSSPTLGPGSSPSSSTWRRRGRTPGWTRPWASPAFMQGAAALPCRALMPSLAGGRRRWAGSVRLRLPEHPLLVRPSGGRAPRGGPGHA
jgi:hypothetical protein